MSNLNQTKIRTILHSDVNNFFASVEISQNPQLKSLPVAVSGNPLKRNGVILAKNYIAKEKGVKTGQTIGEALAFCPNLVCLPPHYPVYEEISEKLHQLYLTYSNFVEPLGLDECWIDVTESEKYLGKTGKEIADEIRQKVKNQFGFTVSVGVSFNKIYAKLGSDLKKPDATTVVSYENFKQIAFPLPIESVIGFGWRLCKKFNSIGVKTISDFVNLDDGFINHIMGITGLKLKQELLGQSNEKVCDYYLLPPPKSIGNGTTTIYDISRRDEIEKVVVMLCEKVCLRMKKHGVYSHTLTVTIKDKNLKIKRKSKKIEQSNNIKFISNEAMKIVDEIWDYRIPVRAIRVRASSLTTNKIKQLSIFDEKEKNLTVLISEIKEKYGNIEFASDMAKFINKKPNE